MRRVVIFFTAAVAMGAALLGVLRWLDPLGDYYDGSALANAASAAHPCLISDDLIGVDGWRAFKEDIVRRSRPTTIVIGTSRVLEIPAHPGETHFANVGLPNLGLDSVPSLLTDIRRFVPGHATVYLGVDPFWLNANWASPYSYGSRSSSDKLRGLLTRQAIGSAASLVADDPAVLIRRWHQTSVNGRCVLDRDSAARNGQAPAWAADGTLFYPRQLRPDLHLPVSNDFEKTLGHLDGPQYFGGYYSNWTSLAHLDQLDRALSQAQAYGWKVVGFTPPYSTRYVDRLSTAPQTAPRWRQLVPRLSQVFARHGFRYVDTRWSGSIGCTDRQFIDDGWHIDAVCGARLRAVLDRAATK